MPNLRDFLKKKEKIGQDTASIQQDQLAVPEFKFIRTTTESEELIEIPSYPDTPDPRGSVSPPSKTSSDSKRHFRLRKASGADKQDEEKIGEESSELPIREKRERKLSGRFHFHRQSRSPSAASSSHLPLDLPDAPAAVDVVAADGSTDVQEEKQINENREAQWEKRATMLAQANPLVSEYETNVMSEKLGQTEKVSGIPDQQSDENNIQEAIRLHEAGELGLSTEMFGRLSDPKGANNALAQVLYGLALRHGWGVPVEPEKAIHYLSLAASNSASVEKTALESGMTRGGDAKGELVLAMFELANCFRYGWGVKKDAVAARSYYETAANLGDTDAMDAAAWCYLEGFGGVKDKVCTPTYAIVATTLYRRIDIADVS